MAVFKKIATIRPDAASNTSLSSAFTVPGEFTDFALRVPISTGWCATTTCNIRLQAADEPDGTYYQVGHEVNPVLHVFASGTSGWQLSETPASAAVLGGIVIMDGFQYVTHGRLQFLQTATASTDFILYGRKRD